ncbi:zinc finger protein 292 [Nematolebias whitei]|uniref:zinc finger protein 292 n=1 Tax=Nematolebias whitei TaxID=451745 RepID=UPI00189B2BB1|nr:zinc finger protein 292 [Nematolebias whitei]
MADEEAEQDSCPVDSIRETTVELRKRLEDLQAALRDGTGSAVQSSSEYCQQFCTLAQEKLKENGLLQLSFLCTLGHYDGVWTNEVLQGLLLNQNLPSEQVEEFLLQEGPVLLQMRVKQLMKDKQMDKAASLSKTCWKSSGLQGKDAFKQMYLVCLCATSEQDELMEKLSKEDCRDALEMICNLDSDGDDQAAFTLCSAFLTRQILHGDTYCA